MVFYFEPLEAEWSPVNTEVLHRKVVQNRQHKTCIVPGLCLGSVKSGASYNSLQCICHAIDMFSSILWAFVQVCHWASRNLWALDIQILLPSSCWTYWCRAVSASHGGGAFFFSCRLLWCRQIGKVLWLGRWRLWNPISLKTNRKLTANLCYVWGERGEGSSFESLGLPVFIGACCRPRLLSILAFCAASEWSAHCLHWDEEPSGVNSLTVWSWNFSAENRQSKWMQ